MDVTDECHWGPSDLWKSGMRDRWVIDKLKSAATSCFSRNACRPAVLTVNLFFPGVPAAGAGAGGAGDGGAADAG